MKGCDAMTETGKAIYDYEDVKYFQRPADMPPFWIEMCGISNCDANYHIIREDSKVCVCEYIIKGSGTLYINGKTYYPKAGDIYILPEFERHEYYTSPEDPWTKIFFNIRGTGVSSMLNAFEMKSKYLFSNCEEFYPIFEKVYLKSRENLPIDQFMGEGCELFVRILFLLHNKNKTADITLEEAQRAKAFIENNIERELSMKEIADSIFRSRDYTNRIFKRYYNVTPYVYYLNLRIEKAKALLQHTSMSIQQISEKLGYKSGKCFSKQFRYMAGMTATDYRKKNHGAHRKIDE
jgi:AraC-like DNA-binding protein